MPNIPDFETLFVQTQEFIIQCNGEHVRYATDSCKYVFFLFFFIQFNVPFKIFSAHMRRGQSVGGAKTGEPRENEKNNLTHPQAELGLSHMWPNV